MTLDQFLYHFEKALRDQQVVCGVRWWTPTSPYLCGWIMAHRHGIAEFGPIELVEWSHRAWLGFPEGPYEAAKRLWLGAKTANLIYQASRDIVGDCPVDEVAVVRFRLLDATEKGRGFPLGRFKLGV